MAKQLIRQKDAPKHRFAEFKDYPHKKSVELPEHFSLLSAQTGSKHDEKAHESLKADLHQHGYSPKEVAGNYGYHEKSFLVSHKGSPQDKKTIEDLAWKHKQESVLHSSNLKNKLVFKDKEKPSWEGEGYVHGPFLKNYFTKLPSGHHVALMVKPPKEEVKKSDSKNSYKKIVKDNIERASKITEPHHYGRVDGVHIFHARHDSHNGMIGSHLHNPNDEELQMALAEQKKSGLPLVIHGNPPPYLREKSFHAPHPHTYDWHDGNTSHYIDEDDVKKAEIKEPSHGNEQAAPQGVQTYPGIAKQYGQVLPGKKSNLQFYRGLERLEPKIDQMIQHHGYQTYIAGGKEFGKPDLKNKNYNTGHLMIWNPKPESGGDFGDEEFTRSWRKLHELAHAITYPEINNLYGEGRRMGKLGRLTPRESKRAVHWEWLAAHKQRELAKQLGHNISDEDFNKELNTIMHDATHRAIHGKFTEPSDEGFFPSKEAIPLEHSLNLVDEHARKLGLNHENATLAGVPKARPGDYPIFNKADKPPKANPSSYPEYKGKGKKIARVNIPEKHTHHQIPVAENIDWHLRNLWETPHTFTPGYKTTERITPEEHKEKHKQMKESGKIKTGYGLKKAFFQNDGETLTNPQTAALASSAVVPSVMSWGVEEFKNMAKDEIKVVQYGAATIKVRKLMEDLYSGWIEKNGQKIHEFNRLTLPEMMQQIQSKLEIYKEEDFVVPNKKEPMIVTPAKEMVEEHKKLVGVLNSPSHADDLEEAKKQGKELQEYKEKLATGGDAVGGETKEEAKEEEVALDSISEKIKRLHEMVDRFKAKEDEEHKEVLPTKDLTAGIENPEEECPACERPVDGCICYLGLPKPRVEFDGKKLTIFFKSEWDQDDRENFLTDLKKRAGNVLLRRKMEQARILLSNIKKEIDDKGKK